MIGDKSGLQCDGLISIINEHNKDASSARVIQTIFVFFGQRVDFRKSGLLKRNIELRVSAS